MAVAALAMFAGLPAVQAADKDVIEYRQNLMKSLQNHAGGLASIMRGTVDYGDNIAYHADAIAAAAEAAQLAFRDEVAGGTSAPSVWENWDDFSERFATLATLAKDLGDTARNGDADAAKAQIPTMFVCSDCHDNYRTE